MSEIFISYSRRDKAFVRAVCSALEARNHRLWVDWGGIQSGQLWWDEIAKGIRNASRVVFVISPDSVASAVCGQEVELAAQLQKKLVPIVCREVDPQTAHPEIGAIHWISFCAEDDFETALEKLNQVLSTDIEYDRLYVRLTQRAQEWLNRERQEGFLHGQALREAEQWLTNSAGKRPPPSDSQKEFIAASQEHQQQEAQRWQRLYEEAEAARKQATVAEIEALATSSEARFALGQYAEALRLGLDAATKLKAAGWVAEDAQLRARVVTPLQQAIHWNRERATFSGHTGVLLDVTFSPDGRLIATAGRDHQAKVWQLDGTLMATLEGHTDWVHRVAFSPDGQILVTASQDKTAKLWRPDGSLITSLDTHEDRLTHVTVSPDGQMLATASFDTTAKLWQSDGTPLMTLTGHHGPILAVKFSPNDQIIGTASDDKTAKLWQPDGALIATLEGHTDWVNGLAFSPEGETLATVSADTTAKLWRRDGTLLATLARHTAPLEVVTFSPHGQFLVTAGEENSAKVWHRDGDFIASLNGHSGPIVAAKFSPDGQIIATASQDKTIRLWRPDGTAITSLAGHSDLVWAIDFSPEEQILVSASSDFTVKVWNLNLPDLTTLSADQVWGSQVGQILVTADVGGPIKIWQPDGRPVATLLETVQGKVNVGLSHDSSTVATAVENGPVQLWQADGTPLVTVLETSPGAVNVAVSGDGQALVTEMTDGSIQLWRADGTLIKTLEEKSQEFMARGYGLMRFFARGQVLFTGRLGGFGHLWRPDGTLLFTNEPKIEQAWSRINLSPDGAYVYLAWAGGSAKLWSIEGEEITALIDQPPNFTRAIFSPDSQRLVTAMVDGPVQLWQTDGAPVATLIEKSQAATRPYFSPDSQTLALVEGKTISLWNRDGTHLNTIVTDHRTRISWNGIAFRPDGQLIASASRDNTIKLWRPDGAPVSTLTGHTAGVEFIDFSPDGRSLLSIGAGRENKVIMRRLEGFVELDELIDRAQESL